MGKLNTSQCLTSDFGLKTYLLKMQISSNNKKFVAKNLIPFLGVSLLWGRLIPFLPAFGGEVKHQRKEEPVSFGLETCLGNMSVKTKILVEKHLH